MILINFQNRLRLRILKNIALVKSLSVDRRSKTGWPEYANGVGKTEQRSWFALHGERTTRPYSREFATSIVWWQKFATAEWPSPAACETCAPQAACSRGGWQAAKKELAWTKSSQLRRVRAQPTSDGAAACNKIAARDSDGNDRAGHEPGDNHSCARNKRCIRRDNRKPTGRIHTRRVRIRRIRIRDRIHTHSRWGRRYRSRHAHPLQSEGPKRILIQQLRLR